MPELNDSDLNKLFRTAGRSAPRVDLADRIMARVAVTPIIRPSEAAPLIRTRTWIYITVCTCFLLGALLFSGMVNTDLADGTIGYLSNLLGTISLPSGNWPIWVIGISACLLMLALLDQLLDQRRGALRN